MTLFKKIIFLVFAWTIPVMFILFMASVCALLVMVLLKKS